jgi:homoserine O-acetyltransferase
VKTLVDSLAKDPNWNGGWYYDKGGVTPTLTEMRVTTLKRYGIDEQLAAKFPDKEAREAEIKKRAESWSKVFDANSLVVLRKASVRFDAEKDMPRIKAKVLYVLSRTDKVFPPPSRLTSWLLGPPASAPIISRSTATSAIPLRASTPPNGRRG